MNDHPLLRSALAVAALVLLLAVSAQAQPDARVLPVETGAVLVVDHLWGTALIEAWDRDEVRIEADHDPERMDVEIRDRGLRVEIEVSPHRDEKGYVDLEIRVPRGMPIQIEGLQVDVEIEGVEATIEIEVVGGDVRIVGGRDRIVVESVHGGIEILGAVADLDLVSTNEDVELRDCTGDVRVESVNGDVRMGGITSALVDVETMNGDILFDATLDPAGDYHLSTHSGDVAVSVAPNSDQTFTIEAYQGSVETNLDVEIRKDRRENRSTVVLGAGTGRFVIETFNGDVFLYDPKLGRSKRG